MALMAQVGGRLRLVEDGFVTDVDDEQSVQVLVGNHRYGQHVGAGVVVGVACASGVPSPSPPSRLLVVRLVEGDNVEGVEQPAYQLASGLGGPGTGRV